MNQASTREEAAAHRIGLGRFRLDLLTGELLMADGQLADIRRQALEVLLLLGRRSGQVVTKDELMASVWPKSVVGDGSLSQAIFEIRKTLGDTDHRMVRNVARRGYMLVPGPGNDVATQTPASDTSAPTRPPPTRRIVAAALLLIAAAIGAGAWLRMSGASWQTPTVAAQPLPRDQVPKFSIAVLPLTVDGDSGDIDWLAGALHGDLITQLAQAPRSLVIARDTMQTYAGKVWDPRQVARELGVRYVVKGSLRREAEAIRLNIALIDGDTGAQRWGDAFLTQHAALARTLEEFATQLERELQMQLLLAGSAQPPVLAGQQLDADELAMRALAQWYRGFNRDNVSLALPMLQQAVRIDPDSARGWHGIAVLNLHGFLNGWGIDRHTALRRIEDAGANLERIDRDGNWTYNAKTIPLYLKGDVTAMLVHTKAWTDRHRSAIAFGAYGAALLCNGRFDDAAQALERALRLSPRDPFRVEWQYRLAMAHFAAGRYELARDWAQTAWTTNAAVRWPPIHAAAMWQLGDGDAARESMRAYLARHQPVTSQHLATRMPGLDPRIAEARDRLTLSLRAAGMP